MMLKAHNLANHLMAKLITTLVDKTTVDWSPYLLLLIFNYNTSLKQEGQKSSFFQLFKTMPKELDQSPAREPKLRGRRQTLAPLHLGNFAPPPHHPFTTLKQDPRKLCNGQKVLFNENGHLPDHKPNWTGPHEFTRNKGSEHTEILILPGCRKILVH